MIRLPLLPSALGLLGLLCLASLLSVTQGPMQLPASQSLLALADALFGLDLNSLEHYQRVVVVELRLPRTLLAILLGALLAQSGAAMQGLFRNPLADPGIIGVSAGAAMGAVLTILLLPQQMTWWAVPLAAFGGGFLCSLLIYRLSCTPQGTSVLVLLLAGVAVSALAGSVIGLASYLSDDARLRDVSLWQLGSLASADDTRLYLAAACLAILAVRFQQRAGAIDALLLGEAEARYLGIQVESLKRELIVLVAAGTGLAVACAGIIGFIGLVVPHMVRLLTGPGHHSLFPLSALAGGLLLLVADLGARLLLQPAELPVGILTALLGAPFFVALLLQQRGRI